MEVVFGLILFIAAIASVYWVASLLTSEEEDEPPHYIDGEY